MKMIPVDTVVGIINHAREEGEELRCVRNRIVMSDNVCETEPVKHGEWIKCDYKQLVHGFVESYPDIGICCSNCRTGFLDDELRYKAYCPACGAKMIVDKEVNHADDK